MLLATVYSSHAADDIQYIPHIKTRFPPHVKTFEPKRSLLTEFFTFVETIKWQEQARVKVGFCVGTADIHHDWCEWSLIVRGSCSSVLGMTRLMVNITSCRCQSALNWAGAESVSVVLLQEEGDGEVWSLHYKPNVRVILVEDTAHTKSPLKLLIAL